MTRYTDENYRTVPGKQSSRTTFLTPAEIKAESRKAVERTIVRLLAKIFRLDLRQIGEAVRQETGIVDFLMLGVHRAYTPKFPADILAINPQRGKGQVFTLNRLLRNPEKYSLIGHFLNLPLENWKAPVRPAMLAGSHPRLGLLAVTNLKMEPDLLCFQFVASRDEGTPQPLILAEIKHLLLAIRRQKLWAPEGR
jgi:hypothetical protein